MQSTTRWYLNEGSMFEFYLTIRMGVPYGT